MTRSNPRPAHTRRNLPRRPPLDADPKWFRLLLSVAVHPENNADEAQEIVRRLLLRGDKWIAGVHVHEVQEETD